MSEGDTPPLLKELGRPVRLRLTLENAQRLLCRRYRKRPLWVFICDLTGHGSTYSTMLCKELGWDPHCDASKPIQRIGPEQNAKP